VRERRLVALGGRSESTP